MKLARFAIQGLVSHVMFFIGLALIGIFSSTRLPETQGLLTPVVIPVLYDLMDIRA